MIYGYKYKTHKVQDFHKELIPFFEYLTLNEPKSFVRSKMFSKSFEPLIEASKRKFDPYFKKLVLEYSKLTPKQKRKVKQALKTNNQIEKLCEGKLTPVKFDEFSSEFADTLKELNKKLWEKFPHNKKLKAKCGTVKKHFDDFTDPTFQKALVCPFCGLNGMKPSKGKARNAYDHYLPKAKYPFTSVNFENLVPICTECNSTDYKGEKDVLYVLNKRQAIFYPFDASIKPEKMDFKISPKVKYDPITKSTRLAKIKWDYDVKFNGKKDKRIDTWEAIFNVQQRYKDLMPSMESEWFDWLVDSFKESIEDKVSFQKFKKRELEKLKKKITGSEKGFMRYSYINFLLSQTNIEKKLHHLIKVK